MKKCPYCGDEQYHVRMNFSGSGAFQYRFDGEEAENGEMHEGLKYNTGKFAYCSGCEKRLFKVDDNGLEIKLIPC